MHEFVQECVKIFTVSLYYAECENYGQRWSCFLFDFGLMPFWSQYKSVWLFCHILTPGPGAEPSTMLAAAEQFEWYPYSLKTDTVRLKIN